MFLLSTNVSITNSTLKSDLTKKSLTDIILTRLSEQQEALEKQTAALKDTSGGGKYYSRALDQNSSSNSLPVTPAVEGFPFTASAPRSANASRPSSAARPSSVIHNTDSSASDEVTRLKEELAKAQSHISRLDKELLQSRQMAENAEGRLAQQGDVDETAAELGSQPLVAATNCDNAWVSCQESQTDCGNKPDAMPITGNRGRAHWDNPKASWQPTNIRAPVPNPLPPTGNWFNGGRGFNKSFVDSKGAYAMMDGPRSERVTPEGDLFSRPVEVRRSIRLDSHYESPLPYSGSNYGGFSPVPSQFDSLASAVGSSSGNIGPGSAGANIYSAFNPQLGGTALSPHATEFHSNAGWKNEVSEPRCVAVP